MAPCFCTTRYVAASLVVMDTHTHIENNYRTPHKVQRINNAQLTKTYMNNVQLWMQLWPLFSSQT
jgi:hypothetical protein